MGVTLYRALLGRLPHVSESPPEYMQKVLTSAPELPRRGGTLPQDLVTIVGKSMEKTRRERYESAEAFAERG